MDAWAETSPTLFGSIPLSDPLVAPLADTKRALQQIDDPNATEQFFAAVCTGDLVSVEALVRQDAALAASTYPDAANGVPALIFAVAFDHVDVAESLLQNHADPDAPDTLGPHYTPLMWAVHCRSLAMVKLLLEYQADVRLAPAGDGRDAVLLVAPNLDIYDYFKSHALLLAAQSPSDADVFPSTSFGAVDPSMDDLSHQIRMLTLSNLSSESAEEEELDEEAELAADPDLVRLAEFDYDKVAPEQYIKFSDSDIPSLLDYIFGLRTSQTALQHNTKLPGAIIFQLLRYSHNKVDSKDLTEFLFECFITRLRAVTNTKSGVFNMAVTTADQDKNSAGGAGDIVLLSYWLSVIQFLHFYLAKGKLYPVYPKFLQELISLTQSLVATLSFSINTRLNLLMDDCLLNYTSLVDVSSVLYEKDWNFFKSQKKHPNTYDDIMDMLFPPSQIELMKPSPLRYVQVLGALDYVLKLHAVDPLVRFQTFSQVFYYINAVLFNRLIANSKYCSRSKAIQIRLNVSALEDWLRSHNLRIHKPDIVGGLQSLVQLGGQTDLKLTTLLEETDNPKDPHSLSFYYKSLYHIGRAQLMPTIELLQWLQVMSGLKDEEELITTINQFDALNYYQLFKVTNKLYRYEVDEPKIAKPLVQFLKRLMNEQGEAQVARSYSHYMTQSTFLLKEVYIYLNPNYVFAVAMPNLSELIINYGSGLGGVRVLRAKKFQPTLPISVMDDVDEILTTNRNANFNETYDYDEDDAEEAEAEDSESPSEAVPVKEEQTFKGDELFKQMQPPLSLAHKNWGSEDIESNPW